MYRNMMKDRKSRFLTCLILLSVMLGLWGCGDKGNNEELSEDTLQDMVAELIVCDGFEANLEQVDEEIVLNSYRISDEDVSVPVGYIGDGASAEEVTLFKCNDTDKVIKYIESYLEEKEKNYESYLPKEAEKIGKTVIKEYKGYVLVCISNDENTIRNIIDKAAAE